VNYNVREFLVQALRSLQHAMRGVEAEVWVVDNNSIDDSVAATLSYRDGSVATVEYLAQTSPEVPKERFEVSAEGRTVESVNYRLTQVAGQRPFKTFNQDKGQTAAVAAVLRAVKQAEASPFSIEEIVGVSRTTFAVLESIARGAPVALV